MAAAVAELTEQNFQEAVKKGTVLIDFYATWCGPCKMMAPTLDKVASEMNGSVTVAKLDVDEGQAVARQFQVSSIPTLVLFKDGKEVGRLVGLQNAEAIKRLIQTA